MNFTRHGKIARLPKAVRDELNRRLDNGESGTRLVAWLAALPDVKALVTAQFGGKPIRPQNLSEWRKGGYRDWLHQQRAMELARRLAEDAPESSAGQPPSLTDTLAHWLAARYALATRGLTAPDAPDQWRQLRQFCADIVQLRRGDHYAQHLRLELEELELARALSVRSPLQDSASGSPPR